MGSYQIDAYLHLVLSVFLTGYALFWAVMAVALRQRFDGAQTDGYLATVSHARWPHVVVPWRLRLPLPLVGWVFLALLVVTGALIFLVPGGPSLGALMTPALGAKIVLFLLLVLVHALLARHPRPSLCIAGLVLTLAIVAVSMTLLR